jgi:hypothetical protein
MIMSGVSGTGTQRNIKTKSTLRRRSAITILNTILNMRLNKNKVTGANLFVILNFCVLN